MLETVGYIFIALIAVYGAADLLSRLIYRLWFSSRWHNGYFVIPLHGDKTCVEYAVRHGKALRHFLLCGDFRIIVVDHGSVSDETTKQLCEWLQVDYVTAEEWKKMQENALQDEKSGV